MGIADEAIIGGTATATAAQARRYLLETPGCLLSEAEANEIVWAFQHWGAVVGVRWDLAFAQSAHETRRYLFGNQVAIAQKNPAGIGATNDGAAGLTFPSWVLGVGAYFVHLMAWCDRLDLAARIARVPSDLDPRVPLVAQVRATKGAATTWASLGGRWAVTSGIPWQQQATMPGNYGEGIARHHAAIMAIKEEGPSMSVPKPTVVPKPSPNRGYNNAYTHKAEAVVWHITQGTNSLPWLTNPASQASANYLIARDGTIYELVPPTESAWANGAVCKPDTGNPLIASWQAQPGLNFNQRTISIEHEGFTSEAQGGSLTTAQVDATVALTAWLCAQFGIAPDQSHILGHYEIDNCTRPNCPGFSAAEWSGWVDRVAALVEGGTAPTPPPAPTSVITPARNWGGQGTIIHTYSEVIVQNDEGRVYRNWENDGTEAGWIELTPR